MSNHRIKAVCLPQNETTSGVVNDIQAIAGAISETGHPAILIVDAVSSLACVPLETDAWGLDLVVSGSQKGLMLPPGLGFVAVGPRAWLVTQAEIADDQTILEKIADPNFDRWSTALLEPDTLWQSPNDKPINNSDLSIHNSQLSPTHLTYRPQ